MTKLGPTRTFPRGKISDDDEGSVTTAIAYDPEKNIVIIKYGVLVAWIGISPGLAREYAQAILEKAAMGRTDG